MAIRDRNILKNWFKRGDKPLASQFADWLDSFWHKSETLPISSIDGLSAAINSKAEKPLLDELEGKMNDAVAEMEAAKESFEAAVNEIAEDIEKHNLDEDAHPFVQNRIDAEETTRANADATLQANVNAEAQARQTADNTLQANVNAEAQARQTADNTLQANINAEAQARQTADNAEKQQREAADTTLQANINAEASARTAADNTEKQQRETADATLQTNINAEASARTAADNTLQSDITALQNRLNPVVTEVSVVGEPSAVKISKTKRNSATGADTTTQMPLPVADATRHGVMPKESYAEIQNHATRIGALEGRSTRYAVTIPNSPTQGQLTALYNTASGATGNPAIDAVRLVDVSKNIVWTWFASDGQWHGPESDTVQQASNSAHGIVKGSTTAGKAFVENDGTMSLNGYDAIVADLNAATTKLDGVAAGAEANVQSDWNQTNAGADDYIKNKPGNASGSGAGLMSAADKTKLDGVATGAEVNVQSDWNQTNAGADDYIKNKPTIPTVPGNASGSAPGLMSAADKTKLDSVATGAEVNVQSDWNQTNTGADDYIKNKPTTPHVPTVYYQATAPTTANNGDIFIPST